MADEAQNAAKSERDPVCGMMVNPHTTAHQSAHDGHP
jgi:Cu+-exporting ATPase